MQGQGGGHREKADAPRSDRDMQLTYCRAMAWCSAQLVSDEVSIDSKGNMGVWW
jgi:hypothetical protein